VLSVPKSVRQSFVAGILALAPLYITLKVLSIVFELVDKPLGQRINHILQTFSGNSNLHIPGLGILCTLVIVLLIGWLTRIVLFKRVLSWIERIIDRVPLVRSLYNASRQIVVPFTDKDVLPFQEVCLVEYPMPGRFTLGMVARHRLSDDPDDDRVVVFFPSNHLHLGYPVVLSRHDITLIDMTIEEATKFFVSCGVVGKNDLFRPTLAANRADQQTG
jgi:uncharacterized membrane protein